MSEPEVKIEDRSLPCQVHQHEGQLHVNLDPADIIGLGGGEVRMVIVMMDGEPVIALGKIKAYEGEEGNGSAGGNGGPEPETQVPDA